MVQLSVVVRQPGPQTIKPDILARGNIIGFFAQVPRRTDDLTGFFQGRFFFFPGIEINEILNEKDESIFTVSKGD